jgi:hypothetical protein
MSMTNHDASTNWTLFRMDSFIISWSGFDRPPVSSIFSLIFCSVIDALCNSNITVDCKIADKLLKKATTQHADGWDTNSKA